MTEDRDGDGLGDKLRDSIDADVDSVEDVRAIREDEMLPDEREAIIERISDLDDEDERLTIEEVIRSLSDETQDRFEEEDITEDDVESAIEDVRDGEE